MTTSRRQQELDRYATRRHWERGKFKSWIVRGFTIAVGTEYPRAKFHASKGAMHEAFDSLDALHDFVIAHRAKVENAPD